jgi:hypothetical protein
MPRLAAALTSLALAACAPPSGGPRPIAPSEAGETPDPVHHGFVMDTDGDGFSNDHDECPAGPEDKDGFEDEDGCPDPDNDDDRVPDADDRCPSEPETWGTGRSGEDNDAPDGCPD